LRWLNSYRYLTRLNVPGTEDERRRAETLLGAMRVLLAILSLAANSMDPPDPVRYAHLVHSLFVAWIVQSVVIYVFILYRPLSTPMVRLLHAGDILWPALITTFAHAHNVPFIPMYSFALFSAAYRWGFNEAVMTALTGDFILLVEAVLLQGTPLETGGSRLLMRCVYLLALGYLIGILGEKQKEQRAESAVVVRLLRAARAEHRMKTVLQAVFSEFISLFHCSQVFLVAEEIATGRMFLWQMSAASVPDGTDLPTSKEFSPEDRPSCLLPDHSEAFFCGQSSTGKMRMLTLAPKSQLKSIQGHIPSLPFLSEKTASLLAVTSPGKEWRLHLFLAGARLGRDAAQELDFARRLFEQATIAIHSVYLLRSKASAEERARVARELHDGAIQSLIACEMRIDVLRRRAEKDCPTIAPELSSLEELLRGQVIELRELMQQLRPVEVEPDQLVARLSEQVERFRRDSGITARFVSVPEKVHFSSSACREILLIAQEALVNVRKHAQAGNVLVSFGRNEESWCLSIIDDGVGFGFEGILKGAELMKSTKGPAIIKERVANLGGELLIDSQPSRGTQLLIKFPEKGHFAHGQ
jgi:signal transduction histidine kinase